MNSVDAKRLYFPVFTKPCYVIVMLLDKFHLRFFFDAA